MDNEAQNKDLTPMERQYREIKARHRDKVLLFRLGDFYEMFHDDAKEAASILNIALTSRRDMPMCGFPFHAAEGYIAKLIRAGKKVAVCEQMEEPSQAKGLVRRDIVSIVTPGTLIDEQYISRTENNYLCSLYAHKDGVGLSFADISTGDFFVCFASAEEKYRLLQDELARFAPAEIIYADSLNGDVVAMKEIAATGKLAQAFPEWYFTEVHSDADPFADLGVPEAVRKNPLLQRSVVGALNYLAETQMAAIRNIRRIEVLHKERMVEIDDFSLRNLELVRNMRDGSKKYTLLDVLDETVTPMGARLLRRWIVLPLYDLPAIYARQNRVEAFVDDALLLSRARDILRRVSDIDRLTSRLALKKALPKDLVALARSLQVSVELKGQLAGRGDLQALSERIVELPNAVSLVEGALFDEPSNSFGGEVIRPGYHAELDRLRALLSDGKGWIVKLQNRERERTGIASLKVKYNRVFGYFIEVSKANLDAVPSDYLRKQSLVNAERFTLPELNEYELQITTAAEKVEKLEEELFAVLLEMLGRWVPQMQAVAAAVAEADVLAGLAEVAANHRYVKPAVVEGDEFMVAGGRHPVVEKYLGSNLFVPNDTRMDDGENRILLITGPNMAGKSTFLRQNALIAVMAQMGSFVPAQSVRMGMVDKIFTRIGASDELSAGRSTFLVEMEEAANILRNMTAKSLIIMDELGRGTSTYDGLSIAWAVIEYLHEHPERAGKTLFATHYHELTALGQKPGVKNYNIAVKEYGEELIFLRRVVEGPADRSYGIYVAKLAGIPEEIVERAKGVLSTLEAEGVQARDQIERGFDRQFRKRSAASELQLFPDNRDANIVEKIKNLDINSITPLEAITFLGEIQKETRQ